MREMKILDNCFDRIVSFERLVEAYRKARKRKRYRAEVLDFSADLDANLLDIQADLISESFIFGPYRKHWVFVPKKRRVMALPFRSRIVQWSIYLELEPFYRGLFIEDSYACLTEKGSLGAALRLQYWLKEATGKREPWSVIKIDISKYFYRVDHEVLIRILKTRVKDERLVRLLEAIIRSDGERFGLPEFTDPEDLQESEWLSDVGMPIGNLTSQLFANIYLNELDQYCKHIMKIHRYVRYMDDIIIVCPSRAQAIAWHAQIKAFLKNSLHLDLNRKTAIYSPARVEFVGYIVTPRVLRMRKRTARRCKSAFRTICRKYFTGKFTRKEFERRVSSYKGMLEHIDGDNLRRRLNEIYMDEREKALTYAATLEALCSICESMAHIIVEQEQALLQLNALELEEEIGSIEKQYNRIIGPGAWPGIPREG